MIGWILMLAPYAAIFLLCLCPILVGSLAGMWLRHREEVEVYRAELAHRGMRQDTGNVIPRPPIPPASSSIGQVEIWGVVTCVRCFDEVVFPASSEHGGSYYRNVTDSETVTTRKARDAGWASVGLFGAPAAWHCPACIESIKEIVYS